MEKKLADKILAKYPKIFKNNKTLQIGSGWYGLMDKLCDCIQNYVDNNKHTGIKQVEVQQVKEKFGGLRFYNSGGDNRTDGMVWFAERMSYTICEGCGSNQNVYQTKGGWVRTLCTPCINKEKKK